MKLFTMINQMDQQNTNGEPGGRSTHLIQILVTFIQFNQVLHFAPPQQSKTFIVGRKKSLALHLFLYLN